MNTTLVVLVLRHNRRVISPWRLVRDGYKELVQMCLFCSCIVTLAAVYAVLVNLDTPTPVYANVYRGNGVRCWHSSWLTALYLSGSISVKLTLRRLTTNHLNHFALRLVSNHDTG